MSLEHLRFLGRFQASVLNDIYLYSVLFYWRMHWDTNLSVSSAHVELCRHSCKIKPEFHLAFIKSLTKRKMTLYRDLIFCCSSLARLHFCLSLVSGPRFFERSAGCLPVKRKVIEHSHWTTGRLFFFPQIMQRLRGIVHTAILRSCSPTNTCLTVWEKNGWPHLVRRTN